RLRPRAAVPMRHEALEAGPELADHPDVFCRASSILANAPAAGGAVGDWILPARLHRIARIGDARVGAAAVDRRPAAARAVRAGLAGRARVAVVAGRGVGGMHAADGGIAGIIGARIAVGTIERAGMPAGPVLAHLAPIAGIGVVGACARCTARLTRAAAA